MLEVWDSGATSDTIIGADTVDKSVLMKDGPQSQSIKISHEGKEVGSVNVKTNFVIDNS